MQKYTKSRLVAGWGINDEEDYTNGFTMVDGKAVRWECEYYSRWKNVVIRCYSEGSLKVSPTYLDVNVCDQWKYFTTFKGWMKKEKHYTGLQLDKDILVPGSKVYSPETCTFVPQYLNKLLLTRDGQRGEYPLGVSIKSHDPQRERRFQSGVVVEGKRKGLGVYADYMNAHRAWQVAKADVIEQAILKYMLEPCYRQDVANAIYLRAEMLRDDHENHRETFSL